MLAQVPVKWIRRAGSAQLTTADICVSRMFLCTAEPMKVGELLKVEVNLPDGPLVLIVVVKNCGRRGQRAGAGVAVFQAADEDAARWRRFCSTLGCELPT